MLHRSIVVLVSVLVLGPALSALAGLDPDLVAWLPMDEGSGTVAYDGSGNGNDGAIEGNVTWADGYLDGALNFGGSDSGVRMPHIAFDSQSFTIAMWINPVLSGSAVLFGQAQSGSTDQSMHFRMGGPSSTDAPVRGVRMGFYSNDLDSPTDIFQDNTWYHVAFWYDYENQNRRIYVDGEIVAEAGATEYLGTTGDTTIGLWETDSSQRYTGLVDDVQIYHRALSDPEVAKIMNGLMDMSLAQDASPAAGATDVSRDVVLSWTAGEFAATHDVYVGTNYDDVANATRSNPLGVLVSQGQTAATYAPAEVLEFGQTYYWRVDEVNAAPDNTIYTGEVWSFAVEPYAYPIENIVATTNGITSEGTSLTIRSTGPVSTPTTNIRSRPLTCGWPPRVQNR